MLGQTTRRWTRLPGFAQLRSGPRMPRPGYDVDAAQEADAMLGKRMKHRQAGCK